MSARTSACSRAGADGALAQALVRVHGVERELRDRLLSYSARPRRRARRVDRVLTADRVGCHPLESRKAWDHALQPRSCFSTSWVCLHPAGTSISTITLHLNEIARFVAWRSSCYPDLDSARATGACFAEARQAIDSGEEMLPGYVIGIRRVLKRQAGHRLTAATSRSS